MFRLGNSLFEIGSDLFGRVVFLEHFTDHLDKFLLLVHREILRLIVRVVHGLIVFLEVVVLAESHLPGQIDLIQIKGGQHSQFVLNLAVVCL